MPIAAQGSELASSRAQLWRITDRRAFEELRRRGQRARRGPLTVTWLAPPVDSPPTPPRAGFAIGKTTGGAVVRNRVRRRLRAALRALQAADRLPGGGTYLLGATAEVATMPWSELVSLVGDLADEVRR